MADSPSVDELWQALESAAGTERVEVLLALATRMGERGDSTQYLSLAEAACEAADAAGSPTLMIDARIARGRALYGLGEYERSAQSHQEAATLAEERLDADRRGNALILTGDSLSKTSDLAASAAAFAAGESVLREAGDRFDAGKAAFLLGRVCWRMDDNPAALDALSRARADFRAVGTADQVIEVDDLRASALLDLDQPWDAVEVLQGVLYVAQSLPEADLPYAQARLGLALRRAGRPEEAVPLLEAAVEGYGARKAVSSLGDCLREQADCHWAMNQTEAAFTTMARARAHLDAAGRDDAVLVCDAIRAGWLHTERDYPAAIAINRRLTAVEQPLVASWARIRLADNHYAAGDPAAAIEVLDAWPQAHEANDAMELARGAIRARALLACGRSDEAWETAVRGLERAGDEGSPLYRAWLYDVRAELGRGDVTGDRAHAIALYLAGGQTVRARELSEHFLPTGGGAADPGDQH